MIKICLQAGHQNCQNNSITALRRSTGAPNEMSFNVDIRTQVAAKLRALGAEVYETDACANDDPTVKNTKFDLFLAIHYDADIYGTGGGFVDFPEPSTDGATQESQRIVSAIEGIYFPKTGIVNKANRRNANTKYYYMWKFLNAKTPCAIIECGVGMHVPDDWQILHHNRALVVDALVESIAKALNLNMAPPDIIPALKKEIEELKNDKRNLEVENSRLRNAISTAKDILSEALR